MEIVVSGIRPTGKLHLGNYFGAVTNFLHMQENYNTYFFIADIHSLTTHPTPEDLHGNVRQVLAEYLAMGLDPEKCALFIQSDVPQISELYTYMNMNAYKGELERSASFKDKIRTQPENVNAGLLTYPVLMAVDILIHKADYVPVGKDQEQHLEMTRTFGRRFNNLYGVDCFPEPQAFSRTGKLVKVPGLTNQGKMSKSGGEGDAIFFDDEEKVTKKKIMRAVTDSGPTEPNSEVSAPVQNLFDIMDLVSKPDVIQHFKNAYSDCSIRYGDLKKQLAEDVWAFVAPIRERIVEIKSDDKALAKAAQTGADKAIASAERTLKEVREIIGFRRFY
ncbi:MAG: tryptophan--tRNA ligase [Flavobacteriales bacterium]|nr:tryptophan--tRNA ligase [Bacteroidota bacterium]MCB9239974.1 tryptophan--tRNA ligase [Flavobacteriales bacterium]